MTAAGLARERMKDYRELNVPYRISDVLREVLSINIIEQKSEPETFVFSEDRERMAKDGTDNPQGRTRDQIPR